MAAEAANGGTSVPAPPSGDRLTAIIALYQAERSDNSAMQTLNAGIVGLAVAYAGATVALLDPGTLAHLGALLVVLFPAPLWIIVVFLGMFSAA